MVMFAVMMAVALWLKSWRWLAWRVLPVTNGFLKRHERLIFH